MQLFHFLILPTGLVFGQQINLFEHRQEECVTRCTRGLISGVDTVVFKSQVNHTEDPSMKYVLFYEKRQSEKRFHLLNKINIQEACQNTVNFGCTRVSQYVVNISIRVQALTELSGGMIFGKLITSDFKEIYSETQDFPLIYDSWNATGELVINGRKIENEDELCFANGDVTRLNIVYICNSGALPCLIELSFKNSHEIVEEYGRAEINKTFDSDIVESLQIRHAACRLDKSIHVKTCTIGTEFTGPHLKWEYAVLISVLIALILLFLVIIISVKVLPRYRMHLKEKHACKRTYSKKDIKHLQLEYKTTTSEEDVIVLNIRGPRFQGDTDCTASSSSSSLYASAIDIIVNSQYD